MKIALLKNDQICYGSLEYFLDCIATELRKAGIQTEVVSEIDDNFMGQKWAGVIGINQEVMSAQFDNGEFVFDYLGCPIFALIVDPPYHHDRLLRAHPQNMHLICLDEGHVAYSEAFYGPFQRVGMSYILGAWTNPIPYGQREIEVLFTGTHVNLQRIQAEIDSYKQPWIRELFEYLIQEGKNHPNLPTYDNVRNYFEQKKMNISQADYKLAMAIDGTYAEHYLRGYYREQIMLTLLRAGITVTIVGDGWNELRDMYPDFLHVKKSVPFSETAQYTANAKIALNVMPWFKAGLHDRIPTSMHNGAVCVTDSSSYIDRYFSDGETIVLFDLEKLNELPSKIKWLLDNPEEASCIAKNGQSYVKDIYTWENMVRDQILIYLS